MRHELTLKAARDRGGPLRLLESDDTLDVLYCLKKRVDAGKAVHVLEKDDVVELTKVEVREDDSLAILLFRRSDPDATGRKKPL